MGVLKDLTSVKIMMQKQQLIETQFTVKSQQLSELDNQAERLEQIEPDKVQERKEQQEKVAAKFATIKAPIEARKKELMKKGDVPVQEGHGGRDLLGRREDGAGRQQGARQHVGRGGSPAEEGTDAASRDCKP